MKHIIIFLVIISFVFTSAGLAQNEITTPNKLLAIGNDATSLDPLAYGTKNTLLVPMALARSGWQDFAYMAAVPAGRKINSDGMPSVVALPGDGAIDQYIGSNYMGRYNPDYIYSMSSTSGYSGVTNLDCSSLDDACCELARFWATSDQIVLCNSSDYAKGLAGSCPG